MKNELYLGDGGSVPHSAQDEYAAEVAKAEAAYAAIMADAPPRQGLTGAVSAERQAYLDRAQEAYDAIEKPAAARRNAQWIPGV